MSIAIPVTRGLLPVVALAGALVMVPGTASAQLQSNESQPGGVENVPKSAPAAPAATMRMPAPQAPAAAVAPKAAAGGAVKDDTGKNDKKSSKKMMKRSVTPDAMPAPSSGAAPPIPGDETRPGGVERVPTSPQPKQ